MAQQLEAPLADLGGATNNTALVGSSVATAQILASPRSSWPSDRRVISGGAGR
jgi:hypothetical protein